MAFDFPNEPSRTRVELAQRIAAYIVDSGLSWPAARARAVEECGGPRSLPGNSLPASDEIETAVRAHYALFAPEAHAQTLLTKRKLALAVLEHLQGFDAYLTGAVLNGAATEDSPICLEVFTDDVKSLLAVLMDEGFDLEALDPQASAFGRADESIGFVLPWQGNMEAVSGLLGYDYAVHGEIVHGHALGRTIGVPTINQIPPAEKLLPPFGVYVSEVKIEGKIYYGITNIGVKPTVQEKFTGVETNLFDCSEDLYGKQAEVSMLKFLRPEQKFASIDALKNQLDHDVAAGKKYVEKKFAQQ